MRVSIAKSPSEDDKRSYYLNSDRIKKDLKFKLKYSVDYKYEFIEV